MKLSKEASAALEHQSRGVTIAGAAAARYLPTGALGAELNCR
jgi:hypothetical protein